jgi:carbonic anhydrase
MLDIVYRYNPATPPAPLPANPTEAVYRLEVGNLAFAQLLAGPLDPDAHYVDVLNLDPGDLGVGDNGAAPVQMPFAAVLGCSDARVPTELIFHQGANQLFVVRVAGNVLAAECLGSVDYAVQNLGDPLKLLVVLGHTGCGAVGAAVDAFLQPRSYAGIVTNHPQRAIIDRILMPVRTSAVALEEAWGADVVHSPNYREALVEVTVAMNAAVAAHALEESYGHRKPDMEVRFAVYDLVTRQVGLKTLEPAGAFLEFGLAVPPRDLGDFYKLSYRLASSGAVRLLLNP